LKKRRVRRSEGFGEAKGSRSQGFKGSSGSLGTFFQNLEAKEKPEKDRGLEGWQKTEVRRQKSEDRSQKSEDRSQKSEDRRQRTGGLDGWRNRRLEG